jgi:hypothetical protein
MILYTVQSDTATWVPTMNEPSVRVQCTKANMVFDIEETSDGLRIRTPQGLVSIHPEVGNSILIKTARAL